MPATAAPLPPGPASSSPPGPPSSSPPGPPPAAPEGPGSASGAPELPAGFAETFTSRYVDTGELRLHAVVGGRGPALLLICGWPQTWYAWRLLMPALAEHFSVVAVDPRGVGLSDKPATGYDTGTLAADLAALMDALGHPRFSVVGHDVGMWTGYALAADHRDRVERLTLAEALMAGLSPSPPLLGDHEANRRLWHFAFNRLDGLNEELVRGRERLYFGHQFATKAARPLPEHAVRQYTDPIAAGPEALSAAFGFYRELDRTMAQNRRRKKRPLDIPVLAIAGAESLGGAVGGAMRLAAEDVREVILPQCGHYPAEEAPEATLAALLAFLAAPGAAA